MMTAETSPSASSAPQVCAGITEDCASSIVASSLYLSVQTAIHPVSSSDIDNNVLLPSRKRTASEEVTAKAAAATARRKRRRALVKRTHSPRSTRLSNQQRPESRPVSTEQDETFNFNDKNDDDANHGPPTLTATTITTIQPTIDGVQQDVPNRLIANETVAIPTECTYEACFRLLYNTRTNTNNSPSSSGTASSEQRLARLTAHQREEQLAVPHVYVPASLESTFLQGSLLRARRYAVRNKEGTVAQVCSFSETHQVLQRLASKLWPGPVIMYVSLDAESTVSPLLQTIRGNRSYVGLRSPCHPLAVKVCQEYERSVDQQRDGDSTNTDLSAVLVGLPLSSNTNNNNAPIDYVTSALRVCYSAAAANVDCVLHGEERREIFSVPTCEHGGPFPVSLWINGLDRKIVILDATASATTTKVPQLGSAQPLCQESVLQALRSKHCSSTARSKKTPKALFRERMVHSVLSKWTVATELA